MMYALLAEKANGTLSVEIYADDPDGGENLRTSYPTGITSDMALADAHKQATMLLTLLTDKGYKVIGRWATAYGGGWRAPVARSESPEPLPTEDGFPDSYRSRKVKGVLEESWYRNEGGVETVVKVVARGRFGAELDQLVRSDFGSDAPPFEFKASVKLSFGDIRKLIGTLTRICDDAEKES